MILKSPEPARVSAFFLSAAVIFAGCRFQGPRLPAGFRLPDSEPPHDPEDETPHALGECQPPARPPFPAAGAGADDASRRQDDSRHHGDDILAEAGYDKGAEETEEEAAKELAEAQEAEGK